MVAAFLKIPPQPPFFKGGSGRLRGLLMGFRRSRLQNRAAAKVLGPPDKTSIEAVELPLLLAIGQMQSIGEIQSPPMPLDGVGDDGGIRQMEIGQAEELGKGLANLCGRIFVGVSQHPLRLQDHALGEKDLLSLEEPIGPFELPLYRNAPERPS